MQDEVERLNLDIQKHEEENYEIEELTDFKDALIGAPSINYLEEVPFAEYGDEDFEVLADYKRYVKKAVDDLGFSAEYSNSL